MTPNRDRQAELVHSLKIGTAENYRKAFNIIFCCYIPCDDDTAARLMTCYVSFHFEKDSEVVELKFHIIDRSFRRPM